MDSVDFADVAGDVTAIEVVDEGIKPLFLNGWFSDFKKLKRADLSRFDTSGCLDMGSLFKGCAQLEQVNLSGLNTASVTNMTCMFDGCDKLRLVNASSDDRPIVLPGVSDLEGKLV